METPDGSRFSPYQAALQRDIATAWIGPLAPLTISMIPVGSPGRTSGPVVTHPLSPTDAAARSMAMRSVILIVTPVQKARAKRGFASRFANHMKL